MGRRRAAPSKRLKAVFLLQNMAVCACPVVLPVSKMNKEIFSMSTLKPQNTRALARGAIIAALYTALTVLLAPLSYGEVQIRFSEAFTLLPILMPEAVPALLVGCLLSNILGGCTIFDIVFGSLATLLAAVCTRRLRDKFWLAALMPVLFNGVIVGAVVHFCYSPAIALPLCMLSVAAGEAVACLAVGPLLISVLRRMPASVLN